MTASIRSTAVNSTNGGLSTVEVPIPAGIQNGDLLIAVHAAGNSSAFVTDDLTKGWWRLLASSVNTRTWKVMARVYNSSDPASTYTLTMGGMYGAKVISLAITGHSVDQQEDLTVGAQWRRQDVGPSSGVAIAPSITPATADTLALAFTLEATTAAGTYSVTTASGFSLAVESTEDASMIEWLTAWSKTQPTADATGDLQLLYTATSGNGAGIQLAIPASTGSPAVATGQIGIHLATSVGADTMTVGFDRLAGTSVDVVLRAEGIELFRQTPTIDSTSGWGHATFSGLSANTLYDVSFEVDSTLQTDAALSIRTFPIPGSAANFTMVTGSCQFTASNHPVWDKIAADNPVLLSHMGDLHYQDATTEAGWRSGVEQSFTAPRMRSLLEIVPVTWAWDNHDRIIVNAAGAGTALNLGTTDPATNLGWRKLAGDLGWASADTVGRTWVIGRVRFIQTDNWSAKTDPDDGTTPDTFLGATQKQWFKDTLAASQEELIVWLCQWTGQEHSNGRWNSFPAETTELEDWINARPEIKERMLMIGGDSHSLQVTDGTRTAADGQRFAGIPNYNISGFNRTGTTGVGTPGWLVDLPLRAEGQPEADWGGYSRVTVTDDSSTLTLLWEGVRVGPDGTSDVMASQTLVFQNNTLYFLDSVTGETLLPVYWNGTTEEVLTAEYHE